MKLHLTHRRGRAWRKTAAIVGLAAAALVARMASSDVKRYVRIKTM
jgi:hypothetical protein